jgi:hypothetical protein
MNDALIIPRDDGTPKRRDQRYSDEQESPMQRLYREWEQAEDWTPFHEWKERMNRARGNQLAG